MELPYLTVRKSEKNSRDENDYIVYAFEHHEDVVIMLLYSPFGTHWLDPNGRTMKGINQEEPEQSQEEKT